MKLFVLIFGGIGVLLVGLAALMYVNQQKFLERAETVTGTVVNLDRTDDGFCPVIDLTTRAGEQVRYFGNVCTSPSYYDLGDQVEVMYDPEDIQNVQMTGFWSQYVGEVVLGAIGLPFLLIGAWGFVTDMREKRSKE